MHGLEALDGVGHVGGERLVLHHVRLQRVDGLSEPGAAVERDRELVVDKLHVALEHAGRVGHRRLVVLLGDLLERVIGHAAALDELRALGGECALLDHGERVRAARLRLVERHRRALTDRLQLAYGHGELVVDGVELHERRLVQVIAHSAIDVVQATQCPWLFC